MPFSFFEQNARAAYLVTRDGQEDRGRTREVEASRWIDIPGTAQPYECDGNPCNEEIWDHSYSRFFPLPGCKNWFKAPDFEWEFSLWGDCVELKTTHSLVLFDFTTPDPELAHLDREDKCSIPAGKIARLRRQMVAEARDTWEDYKEWHQWLKSATRYINKDCPLCGKVDYGKVPSRGDWKPTLPHGAAQGRGDPTPFDAPDWQRIVGTAGSRWRDCASKMKKETAIGSTAVPPGKYDGFCIKAWRDFSLFPKLGQEVEHDRLSEWKWTADSKRKEQGEYLDPVSHYGHLIDEREGSALNFEWPRGEKAPKVPEDTVAVVSLVSTAVRWTPWKAAGGVDAQPITWRADHPPIQNVAEKGEYRAWNRWDADKQTLKFETKQAEGQGPHKEFSDKKWLDGEDKYETHYEDRSTLRPELSKTKRGTKKCLVPLLYERKDAVKGLPIFWWKIPERILEDFGLKDVPPLKTPQFPHGIGPLNDASSMLILQGSREPVIQEDKKLHWHGLCPLGLSRCTHHFPIARVYYGPPAQTLQLLHPHAECHWHSFQDLRFWHPETGVDPNWCLYAHALKKDIKEERDIVSWKMVFMHGGFAERGRFTHRCTKSRGEEGKLWFSRESYKEQERFAVYYQAGVGAEATFDDEDLSDQEEVQKDTSSRCRKAVFQWQPTHRLVIWETGGADIWFGERGDPWMYLDTGVSSRVFLIDAERAIGVLGEEKGGPKWMTLRFPFAQRVVVGLDEDGKGGIMTLPWSSADMASWAARRQFDAPRWYQGEKCLNVHISEEGVEWKGKPWKAENLQLLALDLHGLTDTEIAKRVGKKITAVRKQKFRLKKLLPERFRKLFPE